jgi:hypothetical protein
MSQDRKNPRSKFDLEAEALVALEQARRMPAGPERTEAMKKAGIPAKCRRLAGRDFCQAWQAAESLKP